MEIKKSPKADLENKRGLLFEIGMIVSLGLALLAFSWTSKEKSQSSLIFAPQAIMEEEEIMATEQDNTPPPEPVQIPQISEEIVIVDNDIKVDMSANFSVEDTKDNLLTQIAYVEKKPEAAKPEVMEDEVIPFAIVEEKPTFQGADANEFTKWVNSRIEYPAVAAENNIQGVVYMSFDVGIDGNLTNIRVLRGVDPLLDNEALRVVKTSPKWKPGRQQNKPVKVSYSFQVKFQLR